MAEFKPTEYNVTCVATGRTFSDSGWMLDDPECGKPSMIRADYAKKQLEAGPESMGLYRFADWLPVRRTLQGSAAPVTVPSKGLGKELGLKDLWITFNGWYPEAGARMKTCSFKETEAYSVCGRFDPAWGKVLVVASAGNTARAFAKVCSENNIPLLLSVPYDNLNALWFDAPLNDCVRLIASAPGSDYFDAIALSNTALKSKRFIAEGGAKNIARRDGMACTVLSAATAIGRIPDYYFQAVGSGTGAIAAWEACMRLQADGRFGRTQMQLMVSQNVPFLPMYDAWKADSRALFAYDDNKAREDAGAIDAKVLSNRKPPYGLAGGLYDALKATDGRFYAVTNQEARDAAARFEALEGIDLHPAAAVATASLIQAVKNGEVDSSKTVMLNITGCGEKRFKAGKEMWMLQPSVVFPLDATEEQIVSQVEALF